MKLRMLSTLQIRTPLNCPVTRNALPRTFPSFAKLYRVPFLIPKYFRTSLVVRNSGEEIARAAGSKGFELNFI